MCSKFGELIECRIYYNPRTKKHLGLGKVVFQTQRSAKECCAHFNQTTKMGNLMSVFLDTMGIERSKMVDSLCNVNNATNSSNLIRFLYF
jgi:histone-lysine N-methyltransferase SETD1